MIIFRALSASLLVLCNLNSPVLAIQQTGGQPQAQTQKPSPSKSQSPASPDQKRLLAKITATPHYDLSRLKKLAEAHNPTLAQAKAQIRGERGKALQAGLWPNPTLQSAGELLGERGAGLGEFLGGGVQQEIKLGGKLKWSRKKYQARASAAEQEARVQFFKVMNDVEVLYYAVLAAEERVKLQKELLKSARDFQLTKKEMYNLGEANLADLHYANMVVAKQELEVKATINDLQYQWVQLFTVVGINAEYSPLTGDLYADEKPIDSNSSLARLLKESPELAQARAKLKSDEITVQREKRQPIPNLWLCGQAGYDQSNLSFASNVMINLSNIPIWNRNQGTIEQAKADLQRQKAQVELKKLQLRRSFAAQYLHYLNSLQHVTAYRDTILPEARARYQVNLKSYKNARLEWPVVLDSQKDYFAARLAYIDYLYHWRKARVELDGFLLTGGLEAPRGVTPPGHIDATPQPR